MKEGVSRSLEALAEIGDQVGEAAVKAGYGPTIRADAVKKLVDSVFPSRSTPWRSSTRCAGCRPKLGRDPRRGRRRQAAHRPARGRRRRFRQWLRRRDLQADSLSRRRRPDELMLAMDVVDTLRHQDALVDRELSVGGSGTPTSGAPAPDLPRQASRCLTVFFLEEEFEGPQGPALHLRAASAQSLRGVSPPRPVGQPVTAGRRLLAVPALLAFGWRRLSLRGG